MAALAERHGLPPRSTTQLLAFHRLLVEDPLAPTAIRDPLKAFDDHLADSLVGLEFEPIRAAGKLADLGSGAGLRGCRWRLRCPRRASRSSRAPRGEARFSNEPWRCRMQRTPASSTHAPRLGRGPGSSFDVVTARALAPLAVVVEYAAPLLVGRRRARRLERQTQSARRGRGGPRGGPSWVSSRGNSPMQPYPGAENRHLHLMSKVMETLQGFRVVPEWRSNAHSGPHRTQRTIRDLTAVTGSFSVPWGPCTQSPIRRAGWARRPPR